MRFNIITHIGNGPINIRPHLCNRQEITCYMCSNIHITFDCEQYKGYHVNATGKPICDTCYINKSQMIIPCMIKPSIIIFRH